MKKTFWFYLFGTFVIAACQKSSSTSIYFISPGEGSNISRGQDISLKLDAPTGSFDSVQYYVDTTFIASKTDTTSLTVSTNEMSLGTAILTAKVFDGGSFKEVTTNIVLLPKTVPVKYAYSVINTYAHDTSSYTQGLEFHDGIFYESDGLNGESSLRKVDISGRVLKQLDNPADIFAEGLTIAGDKLIQLTWQNGFGIVYDKGSFNKIKEFPYQESREGWGLCFDGKRILKSDGTSRIYFLNKDTYTEQGYIEVFDNKGSVDQLNELEFIDGKIYANIYQSDRVVIIDPETGIVEGEIDFADLYPKEDRNPNADVLNGIAWDVAGKRLFVTGKKWDKLFEIKIKQGQI
jgi:glutaminyl-peptide cyclotransferase